MRYEGRIYRPGPTESSSYLLQVTMGCSHNKCKFCSFYKDKPFKIRPYEEIEQDILMARRCYDYVPSVFLCDGDPLCLPMEQLRPILKKIREVFPESQHTRMYGTFRNALRKTASDFQELKSLGVDRIFCSLESGSDAVLKYIQKGVTVDEAVEAARHMEEAGIWYGATIILGLGGTRFSEAHIRGSIDAVNRIRPSSFGFTVLNPQADTPLFDDTEKGVFTLPDYRQIFREEAEMFNGINFYHSKPSYFMGGVFLPGNGIVSGTLPQDREKILRVIQSRPAQYGFMMDRQIYTNGLL